MIIVDRVVTPTVETVSNFNKGDTVPPDLQAQFYVTNTVSLSDFGWKMLGGIVWTKFKESKTGYDSYVSQAMQLAKNMSVGYGVSLNTTNVTNHLADIDFLPTRDTSKYYGVMVPLHTTLVGTGSTQVVKRDDKFYEIITGLPATIQLKVDVGYSLPEAYYRLKSPTGVTASNQITAPFNISLPVKDPNNSKEWELAYITGDVTEIKKIKLNGSVNHATITPTEFIADGTTVSSLNFKADDGYKFASNVVITEGGGLHNSKWSFDTSGKTNFDDTVTFGTGATTLTITAGSTTPLPPTTIKVDTTNVDSNVTTNVKTSYTIGDNDSITVTANDGYVLDTTTLNGYNEAGEWGAVGTWTTTDDKKSATVSFTVPSMDAQLTVTTTKETKPTPTVKITLKGSNWSLQGYQNGSTVPVGSTIDFTFKADDNYILHNPKVSWVEDGMPRDNRATLSSDKTTATISLEVPNHPLTFTATTTKNKAPVPTPVNIVYKLTNVTASPKPATINTAESVNFNFDPDNGYHLLNDGSMVQYNELNEIIQSDIINVTNTTGETAHLTVAKGVTRVVITLEAVKTDISVVNIDYRLSHATGDIKTFPSNSTSLKLTLTADDGYIFNRDGTITLYLTGDAKEFTIDANNANSVTTTIDWSNTVPYNEVQTAIVSMEASVDESQSGGGYANIYNVTPIEMNGLANEVLYKITSNGAEVINQNDFIRAYYRIPFKLDKSQLVYPETFKLGDYKSTTTTHQVKNDTQTWDLGTINIKEKYHNTYDYSNVTITLFLPFMNSVDLDPEKVIETPLRIKYVMDMYTGMTTANIYNPDGDVIQSVQDKISTDLPIIQADNNKVGLGIRNPILNNLDTAYVVVNRHIPVENAITYPTLESGILNNYTGNITASDITLPDTIKKAEREQITQLLKEGITIVK